MNCTSAAGLMDTRTLYLCRRSDGYTNAVPLPQEHLALPVPQLSHSYAVSPVTPAGILAQVTFLQGRMVLNLTHLTLCSLASQRNT